MITLSNRLLQSDLPADVPRSFGDFAVLHWPALQDFLLRNLAPRGNNGDATRREFLAASQAILVRHGPEHLTTWLYGIALNLVRNLAVKQSTENSPLPTCEDEVFRDAELALLKQCPNLTHVFSELRELPMALRHLLMLVTAGVISLDSAALLLALPLAVARGRIAASMAGLSRELHHTLTREYYVHLAISAA